VAATAAAPPSPAHGAAIAGYCIILAATLIACFGLRTVWLNDNGASRLATVYSLTRDGSWYIDRPEGQPPNPFEQLTVDKVFVKGRFLSSKPPVMPLAMTGVYVVLEKATGLSLDRREDWKPIIRVLTIVFGILPFAAGLLVFARILQHYVPCPARRLLPLAGLAFCTQLLPFAPQLINHIPGASLCMGAIYLGLGLFEGKLTPTPWRFALFGLLGGLTHAVDLPLTIFIAALGVALLYRFPKETLLWGGLGMLPPLAVHFYVLYITTGMPLPVQTRKDLYLYEGSPWLAPVGIDGLKETKLYYAFHLLAGRHGVFLLYPILLFGWASLALALRQRDYPMRGAILAAGACTGGLFAYYIKSTDNYGGAAYGFRWAIGAMPVLLLMAAPLLARIRARTAWSMLALSALVSAYSCYECFFAPWSVEMEWTTRLIFGPTL
jgi:hypothetical protein